MNHAWTSEMLIFSTIVAAILMAIVIFAFRNNKSMIPVICLLIFIFFVYQPAMKMEQQECERAKAQALQKPKTVNIWLGPVLVMTSDATATANDEQNSETPALAAGNHP